MCSHVVSNGGINLVLQSPLTADNQEFADHMKNHGDGVKDVCFSVDNVKGLYEKAISRGAKSV
jgi:4-hydroxyphenylpyruvate dioxygenase